MKSYEEFKKQQLERAMENDWFDEDGSSTTAVCNRGFFEEIKVSQIKSLNSDIIHSVDIKEMLSHLAIAILLLSLPFSYIPLLISRTWFIRKRANKEMMRDYIKSKKQ